MNQVLIVGRLVDNPKMIAKDNDEIITKATVAVSRDYKNEVGEYEYDFIDCVLQNELGSKVNEYCHNGDIVGIRGKLQSNNIENENGNISKMIEIKVEKITFVSNSNNCEEDFKDDDEKNIEM